MQNVLVTGGSGFIGANFVRLALKSLPDCRIVNLDKLTYAGNPANISNGDTRGDVVDLLTYHFLLIF